MNNDIRGTTFHVGLRYATFEVDMRVTQEFSLMFTEILDALHSTLEQSGLTGVRVVHVARTVVPAAALSFVVACGGAQEFALRVHVTFEHDGVPLDALPFEWPDWSA